jgi:Dockerin type I domain
LKLLWSLVVGAWSFVESGPHDRRAITPKEIIANSASDLLDSPGMKSRCPHSPSARWTLLVLAVTLSTATGFAQNVSGFIHGKIQNFQQTSSAAPVVNSAQPFQFGSLISMGTATINSATLTFTGTSSPRTYTDAGNGDFSILDTFTTQAQMDSAYQNNNNYTVSINTSAGTFARAIFLLSLFGYPTTPLLTVPASNWQSGALAIDPTLDYTFMWNAFANAQAADVIELVIRNSGLTIGPFPATQISYTLPAGSLPSGTYTCDLAFVRVAGAAAGDANIGPGYATLVKDTGFTLRAAALLALTTAVSRKDHGPAGTFDIDLPLVGEPGVECRSSGGNHTLVFTFSNNVVSGNASVTTGTGSVLGSPTFATNTMTVNLTGVIDVQKITVTLSGVTDSFAQVLPDTAVSVNMLIGDTTGNKTVNASDIAQTKGQSGATVTGTNFRTDINASGTVTASDVAQVKANAGHTLP